MSVIICSCLLAFALSCKVTAAINHEAVEEKSQVTLRCPHPVGKVTWSREINGNKVDILTVDGGREIRHNDPGRRYSSQADTFKSLLILRAAVSDTGRYFCNNEPAVDLTVIPPGTVRLTAAEGTRVTLKCPPDVGGSAVPTWSRNSSVIRQKGRFNVSPVDKTLTITDLRPKDSGLYYCDGKPAAYLTVTKGNKEPTKTTATPTEPRPAAATAPSTPPANTDTTKEKGSNKKPGEDETINHEAVEEKNSFSLRCPHPVEGKVTWSREINGNKVDILTVDGDREIRHNDPGRRYSSQVDKSLLILRAAASDAGRYFCNNEPAVDLTVIPPGNKAPPKPTSTTRPTTTRATTSTPATTTRQTTSTPTEPRPAAATAPSTPPANTDTTKEKGSNKKPGEDETAPYLWPSVRMGIGILCLIIMTSITVTTWRKARQKQKMICDPPSHRNERGNN